MGKVIPFCEKVAGNREERFFARIACLSVEGVLGFVRIRISYRDASETIDSGWLFGLTLAVRVLREWHTYSVSQIGDWNRQSAALTLRRVEIDMPDDLFVGIPSDSILVDSNGHRALFARDGRIQLTP